MYLKNMWVEYLCDKDKDAKSIFHYQDQQACSKFMESLLPNNPFFQIQGHGRVTSNTPMIELL